MKVDFHSHSSVSDGLDAPAALVARMAEAGLTAFALTDHDTLAGLPAARAEALRRGVDLISGAEISTEWGGQDDIHVLALFVDEANAEFNDVLAHRQEERRTRGERMAQRLIEAGYKIDLAAIREDVGDGVWGAGVSAGCSFGAGVFGISVVRSSFGGGEGAGGDGAGGGGSGLGASFTFAASAVVSRISRFERSGVRFARLRNRMANAVSTTGLSPWTMASS